MSKEKGKTEKRLEVESKYNRIFSEDFKRNKVKDLVAKRISLRQICELYQVSRTTVYKWLYKYSSYHSSGVKIVVQMESEAHKTQQLLQRLAELERIVGQKQLELDYVHKLIEIASAELGYDLKKSIGAKLSNGSAPMITNTPTP
jgi:transposase-like protein